ncbi:MAG: hypothetical protein KDA89_02230, partial [Planctomycetaceae bacterium]|nr:hypothetical protein [Planctomycetaceae bacterium]
MRSLLKSFVLSGSGNRRSRNRRRQNRYSSTTALARRLQIESLESRVLLASQLIASDVTTKAVSAGDTIDVPVFYSTLDDSGNAAALQSNLISFNLHFDSTKLTYVSTTNGLTEGLLLPANAVRAEGTADDGNANTDSILVTSYTDNDPLINTGWPNTPSTTPVLLFTAQFTVNAGFTGTEIDFTPNNTGVVVGQAANFTFASNKLTLTTQSTTTPTVSIANAPAVTEGGTASFAVTLNAAPTSNVTVNYATASGTATSGSDFTAKTGTLTFTPTGALTQQITVATTDDTAVESAETFTVTLSGASGATIGTASGTGTINDNDTAALPVLSIGNAAAVTEGGTSTFTVTLSAAPTANVTVNFATAGGTATSGSDFTAKTGTLTFTPTGALTQQITVVTTDDTAVESAETFTVTLSGASGATIGTASGTGTINDNDTAAGSGTVQGRKFNDLNGNGTRDTGEAYLNGWTIQLVDSTGGIIQQAVTADFDVNADGTIDPETDTGWYRISAAPGTYSLQEILQTGWTQTTPADPLSAKAYELDQQCGFAATGHDFRDWGGLDEVWFWSKDAWYYVTPTGALFRWNGSPQTALTGDLVYQFSPTYHANPSLLYDAAAAFNPAVTVTDGATVNGPDFGNVSAAATGRIVGRKWNDLNGDGTRDANEPWLNGWDIELVDAAGTVVATTTTITFDINGDG